MKQGKAYLSATWLLGVGLFAIGCGNGHMAGPKTAWHDGAEGQKAAKKDRIEIEVTHVAAPEVHEDTLSNDSKVATGSGVDPSWQQCDPNIKDDPNKAPQCIAVPDGETAQDICYGCYGSGGQKAINFANLNAFKEKNQHCKGLPKPEGEPKNQHPSCKNQSAKCVQGICTLSEEPMKMPPQGAQPGHAQGQGGGMGMGGGSQRMGNAPQAPSAPPTNAPGYERGRPVVDGYGEYPAGGLPNQPGMGPTGH